MPEALRLALQGIIDYAGTYPPAKLPLGESLKNFKRYKNGPEAWIVSRMVCGAAHLPELATLISRTDDDIEVPVTVVGTGGANLDSLRTALESDAKAMTAFEDGCGDKASIEAFEVRLPSYDSLAATIKDLEAFSSIDVYLETPNSPQMADALAEMSEMDWISAKFRTGGIEASAFPSAHDLAMFLKSVIDLDCPFKLTAGLHHPYRRHDDSMKTKMHGFLNVVAACALHLDEQFSLSELAAILEDQEPENFVWSDRALEFRGIQCGLEEIETARELFVGFGSCSVEEPLDDLAALGLLEGAAT